MLIPFAHFGHVVVDLPIFLGPVVVLGGWVFWMSRRDRREAEGDERSQERARARQKEGAAAVSGERIEARSNGHSARVAQLGDSYSTFNRRG